MDPFLLVVIVIALALFFDFTNGFHDTANAMATPVATGAIKPKTAVTLAAVLNLVGAFLSTEVAMTVSKGIINESSSDGGILITPSVILAGLMGAIVWNLLTWLLGLPSSSSHALFGGLIGAAIVGAGFSAVNYGTLLEKVLIPAVAAPLIAGVTAFCATKLAYRITRRNSNQISPKRGGFKIGQIFSSSLVALAHGTNDAQKTMGIITLVLVSANMQEAGTGPHLWVIASCAFAIALGTYTGGWRIMRTMGTGLTEVKPLRVSQLKSRLVLQSWRRRIWVSRSQRRRSLRVPWWDPAWVVRVRASAGVRPARSRRAGCSRCQLRRSSAVLRLL